MARKPDDAEVVQRKQALAAFMDQHELSAQDLCDLINSASLRPISLRAVKSWITAVGAPSSRTPPEGLPEQLSRLLEARRKAGTALRRVS